MSPLTDRADDYEAKIAGLQEKPPAFNVRVDELSRLKRTPV
jgi:hypothetical protein